MLDYNLDQPGDRPSLRRDASATSWSGPGSPSTSGPRSPAPVSSRRPGCSTTPAHSSTAPSRTAGAGRRRRDQTEGFVYTTDFDANPVVADRLHWVVTEAIATAWTLALLADDDAQAQAYRQWFDRWVEHAREYFVDEKHGSWRHQLDPQNRPSSHVWEGKPDVYHAYQAMSCRGSARSPRSSTGPSGWRPETRLSISGGPWAPCSLAVAIQAPPAPIAELEVLHP